MKKIFTTALIIAIAGLLSVNAQTRIYTPALLEPADMAFAQTPDVVLDWTAVTGGNTGIITYELYVDTEPDFASPDIYTTEFVSGYQMNELIFGQKYYWKVRAKDGDDISDWSETRSFNVVRRVELDRPLDAATAQKPTLEFSWKTITGITEYDYQFDTLGFWDMMEVPVSSSIYAAASVDATHGWMVGAGGSVLFYDGSTVTEQTSNVTTDLLGVFFVDATNGWAVGKGGKIVYFNGTDWAEQTSPTSDDLNGVFFVDASNGWAVGKNGTIVHYDGSTWTEDSYSAAKDLFSVYFVDASNGFTVGKAGEAAHYDGSSWTSMATNTPRDLYCCAFTGPDKGYAGGKSGIFQVYQNGEWSTYPKSLTTKDIMGMTISGDAGWAVGKAGTVLQFDGFEWFPASAGTAGNILGVNINGDQGLMVGESGLATMLSDQAFTSPMADLIRHADADATKVTVEDLLFGTNYYWRMRTKHSQGVSEWSGARSFTTLSEVTLDSPDNNETGLDLVVDLKWDKIVDGISYEIQVANSPDFVSPTMFETSNTTYAIHVLNFGATVYWRVRAVHAYDASAWPEPFKFTTLDHVTLTSPANNANNVKQSPLLTWVGIEGVDGFQIQLSDDDSFSNLLVNAFAADSAESLASPVFLEKNSQYYWRVRSFINLDTCNWSSTWSFMTIPEVGISEIGEIPGLRTYPNPASNMLYIQMDERTDQAVKMQISDLLGKPVIERQFDFSNIGDIQMVDVSSLSKGIYMLQMSSGKKVMTSKLIITR